MNGEMNVALSHNGCNHVALETIDATLYLQPDLALLREKSYVIELDAL